MKKLIALCMCAVSVLTVTFGFGTTAFARQETDIEKTRIGSSSVYYEYSAALKTLTISGKGSMPNFTDTSGASTSQPWRAWRADGSVERVVVEEGITSIGDYCFYSFDTAEIVLPDTITRVGSNSFSRNGKLRRINLKNVSVIMNYAFYGCSSLESVNISPSATYIGINAFDSCTSLSKAEFGSMNMKVMISSCTFLNCPLLKSIDIPRYATLGTYAVGFSENKPGCIYSDVSIGAFRDSKAYNYCTNNGFSAYRRLLDSMVIFEGDVLSGEYYDETVSYASKIKYYFTPNSDCEYNFRSQGEVDLECTLTLADSPNDVICRATDISDDDLNFDMTVVLEAGKEYCFTVESCRSVGKYELSLMPIGFSRVSIDWDITVSAAAVPQGKLDIESLINGMSVDFIFNSGYVYHLPFAEGAEYMDMKLHYGALLSDKVNCGDNADYITVGDTRFNFNVYVEHSYQIKTVEPTLTTVGYTVYTCTLCGITYYKDYTDPLAVTVSGTVKVLASPNGDVLEDCPVLYAEVFDDKGKRIAFTDENGFFSADDVYGEISIVSPLGGHPHTIFVDKDHNELGDIGLLCCDFNEDGYVNAKDYAAFSKVFGEYEYDFPELECLDTNHNGEFDYGDWEYTKAFWTYGKLNESIYD